MVTRQRRLALTAFVLFGFMLDCAALLGVQDFSADGGAPTRDANVDSKPDNDGGARNAATDASDDAAEASDPTWSCLDQPNEVTSPSQTVAVTVQFFSPLYPAVTAGEEDAGTDLTLTEYTPVSGLTVEACSAFVGGCASPAEPMPGPFVTDDAGEATVVVQQNFVGYLQYAASGYLPATLYIGNLLADASSVVIPVEALPTPLVTELAVGLQTTVEFGADAGVSIAFFQIFDCLDRWAPGVSFHISIHAGGMVQFYATDSNNVSASATQTATNGFGGAVNVPVGPITVTATLAGTNRQLGVATVLINPGVITTAWIRVRSH